MPYSLFCPEFKNKFQRMRIWKESTGPPFFFKYINKFKMGLIR